MKKYLTGLILIILFAIGIPSWGNTNLQIIYQNERNLELADYFQNDLQIVFEHKRNITSRLKRDYPYEENLKKITKIKEGFLIYQKKQEIYVRYLNPSKNQSRLFTYKSSQYQLRDISIESIKKVYKVDLTKIKKKLAVFPFLNQTNDSTKLHLSQILTKALGYELQDTEKVIVQFMDQEKDFWIKFKKNPQKMTQKDYFDAMKLTKSDAALFGNYQIKKGKLQVQIIMIRKERKTPVYNIKETLPIDESLFANALLISKKIAPQAIKKLPLTQVKIVKKVIKIEPEIELDFKKFELPPYIQTEIEEMPVIPVIDYPAPKAKKSPVLLEINYSQKGIFEIGGMIWGDFKAFTSQSQSKWIHANHFLNYFMVNRLYIGMQEDFFYESDSSLSQLKAGLVFGVALPISESFFFFDQVHGGYMIDKINQNNHFFNGNEIGFKIKLIKWVLLTLSADYTMEWTSKTFTDQIKGNIAFSCYF